MATIDTETRTRPGTCPTHGRVTAESNCAEAQIPLRDHRRSPRGAAAMRPYRCPDCGAKA